MLESESESESLKVESPRVWLPDSSPPLFYVNLWLQVFCHNGTQLMLIIMGLSGVILLNEIWSRDIYNLSYDNIDIFFSVVMFFYSTYDYILMDI